MPSSPPTERASQATNTLVTRITELVQACFTGLYIETLPVAVTAGDKIESLRTWASGRCLSADRAGVYSREQPKPTGSRVRRGIREPGVN
jgi:hypothetical protein